MTAIQDASKSKRWYQLSVGELILVAAIVARLSIVGRDIGSGFSIVAYGFPLPFLTDHSALGRSINTFALLADIVLWILATAAIVFAMRRVRLLASTNRQPNVG